MEDDIRYWISTHLVYEPGSQLRADPVESAKLLKANQTVVTGSLLDVVLILREQGFGYPELRLRIRFALYGARDSDFLGF